MFQTNITIELNYTAPDGSVGNWQQQGLDLETMDDTQALLDLETKYYNEQNERRVSRTSKVSDGSPSEGASLRGSHLSLSSRASQKRDSQHSAK